MKINYVSASAEEKKFVLNLLQDPRFRAAYSGPETIEQMRTASDGFANSPESKRSQAGIRVEPVALCGVSCEKLSVEGEEDRGRILLYVHGGGFVRGSLAMGRSSAAQLTRAAHLPVLAVGYRQAPEHPFPSANCDVLNAYKSLLQQGYTRNDISIVGESSGGALALTLPAWLEKEGLPPPSSIAALSPMADLRMRGASWYFNAQRDLATRSMGSLMTNQYISPTLCDDPLVNPLTGFMSTATAFLLCVGSSEVMLSDVEKFAEKGRQPKLRSDLESIRRHASWFHQIQSRHCETSDQRCC